MTPSENYAEMSVKLLGETLLWRFEREREQTTLPVPKVSRLLNFFRIKHVKSPTTCYDTHLSSMAALQVLMLPVTEIWKLFLLKTSWFLIPQDTRQAGHPELHKILWKSLLGYGNQRGPGLDKLLGLLKVRSVFNQMPSQTHRTFLLGSLLDSL